MKISTKKYKQLRKNYALFLSMKDNGLFEWDEYKKISQLNEFSIDEEVTYEIKKLKFSGLFNGVEVSSTNLEKLMYATVVINRLNNINVQEDWQGYNRSQTTISNYYYDDDDWLFNMLATQMIIDDINDSLYFDNNDEEYVDQPDDEPVDDSDDVQNVDQPDDEPVDDNDDVQDVNQPDDEVVDDSDDVQDIDQSNDEPVDDNMNLDTYNDDNSDDSSFGDSDDSDFGGSDDFGDSDSSDFGDSGSDW